MTDEAVQVTIVKPGGTATVKFSEPPTLSSTLTI
jgi:hypothetical protein